MRYAQQSFCHAASVQRPSVCCLPRTFFFLKPLHLINTKCCWKLNWLKYLQVFVTAPTPSNFQLWQKTKLPTLAARREQLCRDYFNKVRIEGHKLHGLLPDTRQVPYSLRAMNDYPVLKVRTNRFRNSFIPWGLCNAQWFYNILFLFYCAIKVWVRFGKMYLCVCGAWL